MTGTRVFRAEIVGSGTFASIYLGGVSFGNIKNVQRAMELRYDMGPPFLQLDKRTVHKICFCEGFFFHSEKIT